MTLITIVDENDNVIGSKERGTITRDDIYRVVCLWITNSQNQALLSKRVVTKKHNPGKWGPAVAGTVEDGETYDDVMKREAFEELGLVDIPMDKTKKAFSDTDYKYFVQCYVTNLDYPIDRFTIQEEEVSEVKWFDIDELKRLILDQPDMFIPEMPEVIENFLG